MRFSLRFASLDDRDSPTSNSFATPECAKTFCAPTLDGDGRTGRDAQMLLHLVSAGCQLRLLAHNRAVDVADHPTSVSEQSGRMAEQLQRIDAFPLRIGVGKMLADIAEAGGAEERIGDRVGDRVGVAVAVQSALAGKRHAAEHERARPVVAEPVDVEALPDTYHRCRHDTAALARAHSRSAG